MASTKSPPPFILDGGTLFSLGLAFSLMPAAQFLASISLPKDVPRKYKYLFLWHTYDFLTHFILEVPYLYHCFFSYIDLPPVSSDFPHPASLTSGGVYFLNQKGRQYGALHSNGPMARLWQEYAKADHRWGGADTTLISLEILTVGLASPCAMYIAYLITRITTMSEGREKARQEAMMWFLATMLATGELYGSFVAFCPEWLSGNTQLSVDDPVYLWLYLVFFNVLWVLIPAWVLWEAWGETRRAFEGAGRMTDLRKGE